MTGWGQDGPLASAAGHDINYIALSGALWSIGDADRRPPPPLNLLGDFGGGGMLLAFGIVCAMLRARETGKGDIVDAAMCDGVASLMAPLYGHLAKGAWQNKRASNRLDGAAPFYRVYECRDGKWICIAPLEPQFYALFLKMLELPEDHFGEQYDRETWPEQHRQFEEIFRQKTRAEWCEFFEGTDVCFAPVLDLEEAPEHGHNKARSIFVDADGLRQPAPAPRFTNMPAELPARPPAPGEHNETALLSWGFERGEIDELRRNGVM
jgi:alpha-methylacyl-CoA racemase